MKRIGVPSRCPFCGRQKLEEIGTIAMGHANAQTHQAIKLGELSCYWGKYVCEKCLSIFVAPAPVQEGWAWPKMKREEFDKIKAKLEVIA